MDSVHQKASPSTASSRQDKPVTYGLGPPLSELEFPGCKTMRLPRDQIETFEGRFEFWDSRVETAWVVREPTSPGHEHPSQLLAGIGQRIAAVRGSPIACFGAMDLMVRDGDGKPRRIMQADQSLYLRPERVDLLSSSAMIVGGHSFPDVVLEVDNTTDVRLGKLRLYEVWGFPEIWVEVPDRRAKSRPKSRAAGLTIHVRQGRFFEEAGESRAFPGWTAEEIHAAMNETVISARTHKILERVGAALGTREGTGPDDDPLLRSQRRQGYRLGHARGRAEGCSRGRLRGFAEGRVNMTREILASRGIDVSPAFQAEASDWVELPESTLVAAALACTSESDFLARILRSLRS